MTFEGQLYLSCPEVSVLITDQWMLSGGTWPSLILSLSLQ